MADLQCPFATFSRCDKEGSIPLFTKRLEKDPKNNLALRWRARAYAITKQFEKAIADLETAIMVSHFAEKRLAEAQLQILLNQISKAVAILQSTIEEYPKCSSAWSDLGEYYFYAKDYEKAAPLLSKAVEVAIENGEKKEPWHSWDNYMLGKIFAKRHENAKASEYFRAAIESCPTLTVAYLGCCKTNIRKGKLSEAKKCFYKALELNPKLVNETSFEHYRAKLERNDEEADATNGSSSGFAKCCVANGDDTNSGNDTRRGDDAGMGRNSGNSSNFQKAKMASLEWLKINASCIRKGDNGRTYYKRDSYWYSPDTAEHGGAAFKRYKDTKNTMEFIGSTNENREPIPNKHESREGTVIKKKDTKITKGDD